MLLAAPPMPAVLETVTRYLSIAVASWPGENKNRKEETGKKNMNRTKTELTQKPVPNTVIHSLLSGKGRIRS